MVPLEEAVRAYLEAMARVRTENVAANHFSIARRFLDYFASRRTADVATLRRQDLLAFLDYFSHRREVTMPANAYNLGLEFLKRLGLFCLKRGWVGENPAGDIPFQEIEVEAPSVLAREDMDRLLEAARGDDLERILVGLLGEVGLKKQELLNLLLADLELEGTEPTVVVRYAGKLEKKSRRVPLPAELAGVLARYVDRLRAQGAYNPFSPLVTVTGRQVNNILARLCRRAGIRPVNPQTLRDTAAAHLLFSGRSAEEVGRWLGYTPRGYQLEFLPRFRLWIEAAQSGKASSPSSSGENSSSQSSERAPGRPHSGA